jgi:spore maturation protein CgeB
MKKLLFVSTTSSVMHDPTLRALQAVGFDVHFMDFRDHPVTEIGHPVHRVVGKLPGSIKGYLTEHAHKSISEQILKKAKELKPDYILFCKAKNIDVGVLEQLRTIAPTINWYPETMNNWKSIQDIVGHYDYFFEFDKYVVDLLQTAGHANVYYLPFCGDVSKHAQWHGGPKEYDVSFLGSYASYYPARLEILDRVKDLGLHVWGNSAWADTQLKPNFHGPVKSLMANILKIYEQSKIVIHIDSNLTVGEGTGLTMRPFDVTASGAMLIAQDDRPEIFNMFEPGKEFVLFHDASDIREKVEYYLRHDDERVRIAKAGFERVRRDHTYEDRMKAIFDTIAAHGK